MNTGSNSRKTMLLVFIVIIFCTAVMGFICSKKEQFHIDEIWSYALSNSYGMPFFFTTHPGTNGTIAEPGSTLDFEVKEQEDYQNFLYNWKDGTFYHNYITVQPDQRFTYANVYHNQELDNHPPLFYFIIHTICSFFPDRFSKWFGFVPNLIFYAASMLMLFMISKELQNSDRKAVLTMLFWGLSRAAVSLAVYIRMYMLLTLLALCLTYLHLRLLNNFRVKYAALIVIVDILGFLTQYYFYIFAFFITAFTCLILFFRKKYRQTFGFGFAVLGAVGVSVALFPAVIHHVTTGTWTDTTALNAVNNTDAFNVFIKHTFNAYGGIFIDLVIIFAGIVFVREILGKLRTEEASSPDGQAEKENSSAAKKKLTELFRPLYDYLCKGNALILVTFLCTGTLICQLAPEMATFRNRYVFLILPLFAVTFTDLTVLCVKKAAEFFSKKSSQKITYIVSAILILICTVCNNLYENNPYLENANMTESDPDLNEIVTDRDVILINGAAGDNIHYFAYAFSKANRVCAADAYNKSLEEIIAQYEGTEPLLMIVDTGDSNSYSVGAIDDISWDDISFEYQYVTLTHYSLIRINNLYIYELTPKNN